MLFRSHLAAQSLRSGESDLALAGGVTVMATPGAFAEFAAQQGLASDGRCKSFADGADGTGWGEGAGVVVVERLSDARRNGHPVLAVVAATAINQDGASNGLTAPNGPAQQRVIRAALANAGLTAADVDAVEAHGTGTVLGDPIEAQALLATYGQDRPEDRPLWLGSVKSNIAHTQAAAGAAGVIKMVLALRNQVLPATLHAQNPSPHVDWTAGRISLLTSAQPWAAGERPRRAGVSAFGISGTNAHVIIEQAPPEEVFAETDRRPALLTGAPLAWPISARSASALAGQAARLATYVRKHETLDPADIAWSLATSRSAFTHRAIALGAGSKELISGVTAIGEQRAAADTFTGSVPPAGAGLVGFVFAGQGSQRAGMGRELYAASPVFAAAFDRACALLEAELGLPIADVVLGDDGDERADQTVFAQTGLFAVQVGLLALMDEAGVVPDAVAGHSVGEIAAAHAAGVLSLADAARLVAARARLMQALPAGGAMAAIEADETEIELHVGVSVAAVNGPSAVVVSGDDAAVDAVVELFRDKGRRVRRLRVSHAFHSARMEPMLEELRQVAAGLTYTVPLTGWVGALTGQQDAGLDDWPGYWAQQVRQPVRFADAVRTMAGLGVRSFVEIGPDATLSALTLATVAESADCVPLLRPDQEAPLSVTSALARLYVRGVAVDWSRVLPAGQRVELSTYAFERRSFWLSVDAFDPSAAIGSGSESQFWAAVEQDDVAGLSGALGVDPDRPFGEVLPVLASWRRREQEDAEASSWRYRVTWAAVPDPEPVALEGTWIVVAPESRSEEAEVVRALTDGGAEVLVVRLAPDELDRVSVLARGAEVLAGIERLSGIVSLLALGGAGAATVSAGLAGTLALTQALGDAGVQAPLWALTRSADDDPFQAQIWGLGRVVALEHPDRWGGLIDLPEVLDERAATRLRSVLTGVTAPGGTAREDQVSIRGAGIHGRRLVHAGPIAVRGEWTPRGTVLITGGTGWVGGRVAGWVAERNAARVVLTSRSGAATPDLAALVAGLATRGTAVEVLACDTADRKQVAGLLERIGPDLSSVFHAAGVSSERLVKDLGTDDLETLLAAKAVGANHLDELTAGLDLDAFVLFSSGSAIWGSALLAGYAAANAHLDALAQNRRGRGLPATAVAWGVWGGGGLASGESAAEMDRMGVRTMDPERALAQLAAAVDGDLGLLTVADVDWATFAPVYTLRRPSALVTDLVGARPTSGGGRPAPVAAIQSLEGASAAEQEAILTELVLTEAAVVLGYHAAGDLDPETGFIEQGFHSLTAIEFRNRLETLTGLRLSGSIVFDHATPELLARHLRAELAPATAVAAPAKESASSLSGLYVEAARSGRSAEAVQLIAGLAAFRPTFGGLDADGRRPAGLPEPLRVASGAGGGPALVFLTSFFGRAGVREYARIAGQFQGERDLSVIQQPGFLGSEPLPAGIDALVAVQADALLSAVGDEPFVLAGHSTGGLVAYALAAHLERVGRAPRALVLLDTPTVGADGFSGDWPAFLNTTLALTADYAQDDTWLTATVHYLNLGWQHLNSVTVPVLMLRAAEATDGYPVIGTDEDTTFFGSPVTVVDVPGNHFSMMGEHGDTTAQTISRWIAEL